MADAPQKTFVPVSVTQNPAPISQEGQESKTVLETLAAAIMNVFVTLLPSNYVSQTNGPLYLLQFQAIAEQLASIQLSMKETEVDGLVDFTRSEFLWQMVGVFVFPDITKDPYGIPELVGDLTYRSFLKNMILLLLQGSTEEAVEKGLNLLTDAQVEILAKVDYSHESTSGWGLADQNSFEVNVMGKRPDTEFGTAFPEDPFRLFRNNQRILRALKPATKLYDYRHVFIDLFKSFVDQVALDGNMWYYEDFRKFCLGVKEIQSSNGVSKGGLWYDNSLFFYQIYEGCVLEILSGSNASPEHGGQDGFHLGKHVVKEVLRLPFGAETVTRSYTTSPSGLTGTVQVGQDGVLTDLNQDFSGIVEGELLEISSGPNRGVYQIETLLGPFGGLPEKVPGGVVTSIRLGPGILKLKSPVVIPNTGQSYKLSVERLGVQRPRPILGENVSAQFYL